ncbi:MAG: V0D/AC39 family V-type ATPase subunit, partial [Candidatus Woesearchaeota archaeon]
MENNALLILIGSIIVVTAFFIFPAFKYGPLAYGVARVRAKKSKLLSESDLQELSKESFKEIIYSLQEKGYPSLIEYVEDSYPISEIQKKLRETYMQELKQIYMYIPQKHKAFFKVLLMQQDLEIIIAILRGIIYNTDSSKNTTSKQTQNIEIGSHTISGMLFTEKDLESVDTMTLEDIKKILSNPIFESFAKQKIDTLTKDDDIQTMLYDMYYTK